MTKKERPVSITDPGLYDNVSKSNNIIFTLKIYQTTNLMKRCVLPNTMQKYYFYGTRATLFGSFGIMVLFC